VLITAGERDPIAPAALAGALERRFRADGAASELLVLPGAGHAVAPGEVSAVRGWLGAAGAGGT
jgi:phospholipase/carboxylesterase